MNYLFYLIIAVMADVIGHYVRKWLDSDKSGN